MRAIIGGAHNGKRKYVKAMLDGQSFILIEGRFPTKEEIERFDYLVIADFEKIIESHLQHEELAIVSTIMEQLLSLKQTHQVVCICTDISRGVVPLEADMRRLRDVSGWLYQQIFEHSEEVTRIWYGLAEKLKEQSK